jgi:cobalt-zinc-cadmium resistance protein CzcA
MFNEMKEAFWKFYISIPIAIFLILTLLCLFYGNIRNVVLTIVAPICTVFGGLINFLLTEHPLSVSAAVAFILVIGISISYISRSTRRKKGRSPVLNVHEKFRLVLMV